MFSQWEIILDMAHNFHRLKKEMGLCSENAWLNTKTGWFSINKMEGVISTFLFCAC